MEDAVRIEGLPGLHEVHTEPAPPAPPLSVHLKMEHESPARQPQLPGCTSGALNADRNMVGGPRTEILRALLDGHIDPQAPGVPTQQPVTPEPIVLQRNTGGVYVVSRHLDRSYFFRGNA